MVWELYSQEETVMLAMRKVERQISQGLLKLRADLDTAGLASDVGIRTHLLSCLMSYEPFWLLLVLACY